MGHKGNGCKTEDGAATGLANNIALAEVCGL